MRRGFLLVGLCAAGSAQSVKLNLPLPFGPEVNGERVFESALGAGRVVFRSDRGARDVVQLFSAPLDGSAPDVRLNGHLPLGGDVLSFLLTPDGTRVLYLADQTADEEFSFFSVPVDGSAPPLELPLGFDSPDLQKTPQITADGSLIVYLSRFLRLMAAPTDG